MFDFLVLPIDINDAICYAHLCKQSFLTKESIQKIYKDSTTFKFVDFIEDEKTSTQAFIVEDSSRMYITFRGTDTKNIEEFYRDAKTDLKLKLVPFDIIGANHSAKVHQGFLEAYKSIKLQLHRNIAKSFKNLVIVGHSLGAALAEICAIEMNNVYGGNAYRLTVQTVNFACPRIGDENFARWLESGMKITRFVNKCDPIPSLPPKKLGYYNTTENAVHLGSFLYNFIPFTFISFHFISKYISQLKKLKAKMKIS